MAETRVVRPKVFVSSTIMDMVDLRDAMKFWLEEMGFEVQLSEHTDFERRPDDGTFKACFESIRHADYYVLLIGERVGQLYDDKNRISITRQEYRVAYESWERTRTPKVVSLVRTKVMTILRERRTSNAVADTASQLEGADLIAEFVEEVRREEETHDAASGKADYPGANWLSEFANFRELTDGLRSTLGIRGSLSRMAILENLRHELERNLRLTMRNLHERPFYHHLIVDRLRDEIPIELSHLRGEIPLTYQQIKWLVMYQPSPAEVFVQGALQDAVLSGALLDYGPEEDRFVPSPLLEALYKLREELAVYGRRYSSFHDDSAEAARLWFQVKDSRHDGQISAMTLVSIFGLHDSERNLVRILVAILRYVYEHTDTIEIQFRPISPIIGEQEEIQGELVSEEQLREWLEKDSLFITMGTTDVTDEHRAQTAEAQRAMGEVIGEEKAESIMMEVAKRTARQRPETREEVEQIAKDVAEEMLLGERPPPKAGDA